MQYIIYDKITLLSNCETKSMEDADFFYIPTFVQHSRLQRGLDLLKKRHPDILQRKNGSDHILVGWGTTAQSFNSLGVQPEDLRLVTNMINIAVDLIGWKFPWGFVSSNHP